MKLVEYYWRYDSVWYGNDTVKVYLCQYTIDKRTPKGVWVTDGYTRKHVLHDARKKFAYPSVQEALVSFQARKVRQVQIVRAQLRHAEIALSLIKEVDDETLGIKSKCNQPLFDCNSN